MTACSMARFLKALYREALLLAPMVA